MGYYIDVDFVSLNKYREELCGDKVEIIRAEDSVIAVLADGLSSGVKANILATLTSKIIGTMLSMGSSIEEAVETVIHTLPITKESARSYTKLTVLQIFNNGEGFLIEFENPKAIRLYKGKSKEFKKQNREISGKTIKESRFTLTTDDVIVLLSDGAIHAGEHLGKDRGWKWENVRSYVEKIYKKDISAKNITKLIITACNNLYNNTPEHDTTVICAKIKNELRLNVLVGPPIDTALDNYVVNKFINSPGKKVVCGGTTSVIVKRVTGREWVANFNYLDVQEGPMVDIEGIDLTTEGRKTLLQTLGYVRAYVLSDSSMPEAALADAAVRLTRLLVDESTEVCFFVGRTENKAQMDAKSGDMLRSDMVIKLEELLIKLGKRVEIEYF